MQGTIPSGARPPHGLLAGGGDMVSNTSVEPESPKALGPFLWRIKMEQEQRSAVRTKEPVTNDVAALLGQSKLLQAGRADVARIRERTRQRRLLRLGIVLGIIDAYLWYRFLSGNPFGAPRLPNDWVIFLP